MPLYIKDPTVDSLLEQYLAMSGAPSKAEAVRRALTDQIKALALKEPLANRVARIQDRAELLGFKSSGNHDGSEHKRFFDALWGEE